MPCKRKAQTSTTKVVAKHEVASQKDSENDLWLKSGISWIHKAKSGIFSTDSHCGERFFFDDPLQFGSQIHSYATSDENSGCKSCSGQGVEKLETIPAWKLEQVTSKKEVLLEAQREKIKSTLVH